MKVFVRALLLSTALVTVPAAAQNPPPSGPLRVFLDCGHRFCDFDFFRTEIPWVNYVRTRQDADVHILGTAQGTGGGGTTITLDFIGQRRFEGRNSTVLFTASATDTGDQARRGLVQVVQASLAPYVVQTDVGAGLRISVEGAAQRAEVDPAPFRDPWNLWTFRLELNGWFNGEDRFRETNVDASASANRTTEDWKLQVGLNNRYSESVYELNDSTTVVNVRRIRGMGGLLVRSLGRHLSVGGRASVNSSTYLNQDLAVRIAPAVEYNVFPYSESTRREMTVQYSLGTNFFDYQEITLLGEVAETRMDQTLRFDTDFTQPWGSADLTLEGSHFLDDVSKNRLEAWGGLNLRVVKGLQLRLGGNVARVRNQIYLPAGELTQEEILLRQRALATGFRYSGSMGISYTFGSIFNNVVNSRF